MPRLSTFFQRRYRALCELLLSGATAEVWRVFSKCQAAPTTPEVSMAKREAAYSPRALAAPQWHCPMQTSRVQSYALYR